MDPYDGTVLADPFDPQWEPIRRAMGHTLRFANRMNLAACRPASQLASTEYCLANPGHEYLVYLPDGGTVKIDLSAAQGALDVEWFDPSSGETRSGDSVRGGASREFTAPLEGDVVLYVASNEK
jgi:hypothetical protein